MPLVYLLVVAWLIDRERKRRVASAVDSAKRWFGVDQ